MNLTHLQHFAAVADGGSVRLAAEALKISQPAISRSLRALESTLGVLLFVRDSQGSRLTEAGKVLYERAKLIATEIARIPTDLAELQGEPDDIVKIACSATAGVAFMPAVLQTFHDLYPKVQLHVLGGLPSSHLGSLADGSLDLVIGSRPRRSLPSAITAQDLFSVNLKIAVGQDHPLRFAKALIEFADAPWVVSTSAADMAAELRTAFLKIGVLHPNIAMQSDSLYFVQALVARTNYVSLIPEPLLKVVFAASGLHAVSLPEFESRDTVAMFWQSNRRLSRAATRLANAIRLSSQMSQVGLLTVLPTAC